MNKLPIVVCALVVLVGCSRAPDGVVLPPPATAQKHIPGIEQMNFDQLSSWVRVCAPYNGSLEGRQRNPYDPMDCDAVQYRHDSWRTKSTQKPAAYLPSLH